MTVSPVHVLIVLIVPGLLACGHPSRAVAPAAPPPALHAARVASHFTTESPTFFENRLRGFVYHWFSLFDSNAVPEEFLERMVQDQTLEFRFPEATLRTAAEFRGWYDGILKNVKLASHAVNSIRIRKQTEREFIVDVDVLWRGVPYEGDTIVFHANQEWHVVVGGTGFDDIRIRRYIVVPAP